MGYLLKGKWEDKWNVTHHNKGAFVREKAKFHNWISVDKKSVFPAEVGRYHLYVSPACPWSHRAIIFLTIKNLQNIISMSLVEPHMLENGWEFASAGNTADPINGFQYLHQVYTTADPEYSGRVTVPVLWDKKNQTIVNNESSEIIRMFNSEFNHITGERNNFYPEGLRDRIDSLNTFIYEYINNGVYRAGFATTQDVYENAVVSLFEALDAIEARLSGQKYLFGDRLTEADWRLFPTLIRFDVVYYSHFKTNLYRLSDYPNLFRYTYDLFQFPGIRDTTDWFHIKQHYFYSHHTINPTRIVPLGPIHNFDT